MKDFEFKVLDFPLKSAAAVAEEGWGAVERYLAARRAPATETAYEACLGAFRTWAAKTGRGALPAAPETLALFLAGLADRGYAVSTLRHYLSAIGAAHVADGLDNPTKTPLITALIDGIARERGTGTEGKAALSPADLILMVDALPETQLGIRDGAIILLGFSS